MSFRRLDEHAANSSLCTLQTECVYIKKCCVIVGMFLDEQTSEIGINVLDYGHTEAVYTNLEALKILLMI